MHVVETIQKKRDNLPLRKDELKFLIDMFVCGEMPDYQMSAFLMAISINGLNDEETSWLTDVILYSGQVIEHKASDIPLIDKHSTGGVGDKISIPLAPAAAACGLRVPMISGRGLGHTGGTLDKLESIPGFRTNLSVQEFKDLVTEIGCAMMGQTKEVAPADKMLYALRDVTATIDSIPLIASSIMSKKLASGLDGLVLDVKFGAGAFMKELKEARNLAKTMVSIGAQMGKKVTACLTNMDQPLGSMVGNALEIIESIEILQGKGPKDTRELTVELGAEMLLLGAKVDSLEAGRLMLEESLDSGRAFKKFLEMVEIQGGNVSYILEPTRFRPALQKVEIKAVKDGYISGINSRAIGHAVSLLGAGRMTLKDEINAAVGLELLNKVGDPVFKGQAIAIMHVDNKGLDAAKQRIEDAISIGNDSLNPPKLCYERISTLEK